MTRADLATWSRAPLALGLMVLTVAGDRAKAAVVIILFAVIDCGDGWLARQDGTESPQRRAVDSVIDRLAVVGFFVAAAFHDPFVAALAIVMVGANVGLAVVAYRSLRHPRQVLGVLPSLWLHWYLQVPAPDDQRLQGWGDEPL